MVNAAPGLGESDCDFDAFDCCFDVVGETGAGLKSDPIDTAGCVLFDFSLPETREGVGDDVGGVLEPKLVDVSGPSLTFADGCVDDSAGGDGFGVDIAVSSLSIVALTFECSSDTASLRPLCQQNQ